SRLHHREPELAAIFTLFLIENPTLPPEMLQRGCNFGKWERARSQGNLLSIMVVAQVERDDATVVFAQECGHVRAAAVGMACIEQERDQRRITLRVERFDFAQLGLKLPPMVVIGEWQAEV